MGLALLWMVRNRRTVTSGVNMSPMEIGAALREWYMSDFLATRAIADDFAIIEMTSVHPVSIELRAQANTEEIAKAMLADMPHSLPGWHYAVLGPGGKIIPGTISLGNPKK